MNTLDIGKLVFKKCSEFPKEMPHQEKFAKLREYFPEFTMANIIIVKYMAAYSVFDFELFSQYLARDKKDLSKNVEDQIFFYVKNYLQKKSKELKLNKFDIQKICNNELAQFQQQYNKLLKFKKKAEKDMKSKDIDQNEELKKELIKFVCENH